MSRTSWFVGATFGIGCACGAFAAAAAPAPVELPGVAWSGNSRALASGRYDVSLQSDESGRIVGTLRQGKDVVHQAIPFVLRGCRGKTEWTARRWSTRGTTRALPSREAGKRRVELRLQAEDAPGCLLVGSLTINKPPVPARPVDPGRPD